MKPHIQGLAKVLFKKSILNTMKSRHTGPEYKVRRGRFGADMRVMDVPATCRVDRSIWLSDVCRGDWGQ